MAVVGKDLTAGTIGGVAQVISSHPFDTIKVRLQSQPTPPPGRAPKNAGAMDALKQTMANEGARAVRGQLQKVISGGGPGFAASFIACPTALIKCRLQKQSALAGAGYGSVAVAVKYTGPIDVAKHMLRKGGVTSKRGSRKRWLAGGCFWASTYPIDVVKSKIRTDDYRNPKELLML